MVVLLDVEPAINEQRCKCKVTITQLTPNGVVRNTPVHHNDWRISGCFGLINTLCTRGSSEFGCGKEKRERAF